MQNFGWKILDDLGGLGIVGRIIWRWIIERWDVSMLTGFIWLKIGSSGFL